MSKYNLEKCKQAYQELNRTEPESLLQYDLGVSEWQDLASLVIHAASKDDSIKAAYEIVSSAFVLGFIRGMKYQQAKAHREKEE